MLVQVGIQGAPQATGVAHVVLVPLGYVGLLAASVLVVRPIARQDGGSVVDAAIGSLAVAGLLWAFVILPVLEDRGATVEERAVTLISLLLVCGLAGAIARALVATQQARPPLAFLLLATTASVAGNVASVLTADQGTGAAAHWVGTLWIVGYVATAAAVLHPASAHLATPGRLPRKRLSVAHLLFLWIALSLNPATAVVSELTGHPTDVLLQSIVSLLIAPLILLRVWRTAELYELTRADLVHEATHDALTGLANRRAAVAHLEQVIDLVRSARLDGARLCFLDLDDFKTVNDELGHAAGDQLLVAVAERLRAAVRHDDFVGRFGGDEFLLVLVGSEAGRAARTVERIRSSLGEPVDLDGDVSGARVRSVGVSVGTVAVRRGDTATSDELLSLADARMYEDKRRPGRSVAASRGAGTPETTRTAPHVGS